VGVSAPQRKRREKTGACHFAAKNGLEMPALLVLIPRLPKKEEKKKKGPGKPAESPFPAKRRREGGGGRWSLSSFRTRKGILT